MPIINNPYENSNNATNGYSDRGFNFQNWSDFVKESPILGSNFGYLQDTIKSGIEKRDPIFDELLGNYKRRVGAITDENVRKIAEQAAQSGFRGTSANTINQAYKNQGEAVGAMADSLATKELDYKNAMIKNLLGLGQFEAGQYWNKFLSDRGSNQFLQGLKSQEENQPSEWGQVFGNIASAGATIGAAAISDKKVKENIKKVGKTDSGLPVVEFNYKEDPDKIKVRGHLAQDVEKIFPQAVLKAINYNKLPEDAVFEIIG